MSGFSAAWLALREPYDARARNADVFSAVAALFKHRDLMQIVDLACGTGSAVRALGPRSPRDRIGGLPTTIPVCLPMWRRCLRRLMLPFPPLRWILRAISKPRSKVPLTW